MTFVSSASKVISLLCCLATVCAFYDFPYGGVYPAFDGYNENYNPHFRNPFTFEEGNEQENGDEEDELFTPDEEPVDEFEPVKRSEIKMPEFLGESTVKRDLIKGPSFQPNINEEDADSDLENENKEAIDSLLAKRKDIFQPNALDSDDEEIQGKDSVKDSLTSPTESSTTTLTNDFLNGIQNDINKAHNQVTKHVIHVDYTDTSTPAKNTTTTDVINDHKKVTNNNFRDTSKDNLQMTKKLIGLLFDFDRPSSDSQGEDEKTQKEKAINECKCIHSGYFKSNIAQKISFSIDHWALNIFRQFMTGTDQRFEVHLINTVCISSDHIFQTELKLKPVVTY